MRKENIEALKELDYAALNREQEEKLRQLESNFNNEFSKEFYFMVMERKND